MAVKYHYEHFLTVCRKLLICLKKIVLKVTIFFGIPHMQWCHMLLCAASVVE